MTVGEFDAGVEVLLEVFEVGFDLGGGEVVGEDPGGIDIVWVVLVMFGDMSGV